MTAGDMILASVLFFFVIGRMDHSVLIHLWFLQSMAFVDMTLAFVLFCVIGQMEPFRSINRSWRLDSCHITVQYYYCIRHLESRYIKPPSSVLLGSVLIRFLLSTAVEDKTLASGHFFISRWMDLFRIRFLNDSWRPDTCLRSLQYYLSSGSWCQSTCDCLLLCL